MRVTENMKITDVLAIGEHMLDAFMWLAPEFERLQYPKLRRAMGGRVTVSQAARIARVPLTEALYVLNLAAGSDAVDLTETLRLYGRRAFEYKDTNPPVKPREIANLEDSDARGYFGRCYRRSRKTLRSNAEDSKGIGLAKGAGRRVVGSSSI